MWDVAPTYQSSMADGVMRGAEVTLPDERRAGRQLVSDRVDAGHVQGFFDGHFRQDSLHGARQHGLPGAGGADHQHVMSKKPSHFTWNLAPESCRIHDFYISLESKEMRLEMD